MDEKKKPGRPKRVVEEINGISHIIEPDIEVKKYIVVGTSITHDGITFKDGEEIKGVPQEKIEYFINQGIVKVNE